MEQSSFKITPGKTGKKSFLTENVSCGFYDLCLDHVKVKNAFLRVKLLLLTKAVYTHGLACVYNFKVKPW